MLIRWLEVEDFRGVRGPVKVELGAGINVWHGPNEIGKSTLVEALRSVLVLPAKSSSDAHRAMATRGGDKTPRVALGFRADDGTEVTVQKSFGGSGKISVELRKDGDAAVRLDADRADEALREMLRVGPASRGAVSDPGPFGLVFVAQGSSRSNPAVSESTRVLLREQLASLSSEWIAGPESLDLLARAKERYAVHFTDAGTEKASKDAPLAMARTREKTAVDEARVLEAKRVALDAALDEADRCATELARLDRDLPGLEARADAARVAVEGLAEAKRTLDEAETASALAVARAAQPTDELRRRQELRSAIVAAETSVDDATVGARGAALALDEHDAGRPDLERASSDAATALRDADRDRKRASVRARIGARRRDLGSVRERLAHATDVESKRKALREVERGIDASLASAIAESAEALAKAERQLEGASASVRIRVGTDLEASVDGQRHRVAAGEVLTLRLASPTTIALGETATIAIDPGGDELPQIRASLEGLRAKLDRRLADAGVATAEDARAKDEARASAARELVSLDRELSVYAKEGLAALTATKVDLEHRLAEADAELAELGDEPVADAADVGELERAHRDAEARVEKLRDVEKLADAALGRHRDRATKLREAATKATATRDAVARDRERIAGELDAHVDRFGDDAKLDADVRALAEAVDAARRTADARREALDAMKPDELTEDAASTTKALANATKKREKLATDLAVVRGRLDHGDALGLDDRVARARAAADEASRTLRAAELDAAASKLLFETLSTHKSRAEARFRAPLEKKVRELLGLVLGSAELTLEDQTLAIAQLDRGDHRADDFDQLSSGAQEQLGVIVRLAMAELLAGNGTLPVTLDDALVFTDERRFQGMLRVLQRVARHLQIVFVTCQWDRYRALGLAADVEVDLGGVLGETR